MTWTDIVTITLLLVLAIAVFVHERGSIRRINHLEKTVENLKAMIAKYFKT